MKRRPLLGYFVFALLSAGTISAIVMGVLWCRIGRPSRADDLPDSLIVKGEREKAEALARYAEEVLQTSFYGLMGDDIVTHANLAAAKLSIRAEPGSWDKHRPLAIGATIFCAPNGVVSFNILGLNYHRETDQIIIAALMPNGKQIWIVVQYKLKVKDNRIVPALGFPVRFVPLEQLIESTTPNSSGDVVMTVDPWSTHDVSIPASVPLAAAIRDRNGWLSNFVPVAVVRELKSGDVVPSTSKTDADPSE